MTIRITNKDLAAVLSRINRETNSPLSPYTLTDGKHTANIGNYHLSGAYGGVSLHRMVNESGGISDVFGCGHVTKRELYTQMHAFLRGLNAVKAL